MNTFLPSRSYHCDHPRYSEALKFILTGIVALLVIAQSYGEVSQAAAVNLAVGITRPADRISISSNLVYSVAVTNIGEATATGVRVTNELALEMTFLSATTSQGSCAHAGKLVICNLGSLAPGARAAMSIRTQPTVQGTVFATATVESDQVDANPEDNSRVVANALGVSDLALTINNPSEPVLAGQVVTYVLTVSNLGPDTCDAPTGIFMSEVDDSGNELLSVTPTKGTTYLAHSVVGWDLLSLDPGETATLTIEIRLLLARGPGVPFGIAAYLNVSPDREADPNPQNNNAADTTVVTSGPGVIQFAGGLDGAL